MSILKGTGHILLVYVLLETQNMLEWDSKIPRHLTVLEIIRSPVLLRHPVPLKYGQGGLESFKAALLEHFMSTY